MGTVPVVPSTKPPIGKTMPIVLALTGAIALIGVSTAYNVMTSSGHKQDATKSMLPARPSTADTQQVGNFQKQQALIQKSDAEHAQLQQAIPGIYADVANTKNAILETNYSDGKLTQQTGFAAAFGGNTSHSRTLAPNEKVYVMQITVRKESVLMELLTVDVTTLGDGRGTRYRADLNVKLPGLENMTPEDIKKTIDTVLTDPATASAVESKTIKLGMSTDQVKKSLGNPDKIVDLGAKQIYVYKDMKVIFLNSQVSDVQ